MESLRTTSQKFAAKRRVVILAAFGQKIAFHRVVEKMSRFYGETWH